MRTFEFGGFLGALQKICAFGRKALTPDGRKALLPDLPYHYPAAALDGTPNLNFY